MSTSLLLTHLQNQNTHVPLETLIGALAHHLSVDLPTPTSLTAAAVSSPYFNAYSPTNERLQGLVTAFRHAVHLKHRSLGKKAEDGWSLSRAVFSKGVDGNLRDWFRAVTRGLQGGPAMIRLACCTGLLLGAHGLSPPFSGCNKVEDEAIIGLAEFLDDLNPPAGDWEKEFRPQYKDHLLPLALILASQSLPLIPKVKLKALPLSTLASFLTSTITRTFHEGGFLGTEPETVKTMSTSPEMNSLAGLSRLTALTLGLLIETSPGGIDDAYSTLQNYQTIASRVERDWKSSEFASILSEDELGADAKESYKSVWLILKSLLFSILMVSDGILGAIVYVDPAAAASSSNTSRITIDTLAKSILQTLFLLSFVVSQFGGVTATAVGDEPGFVELRKVFYLALDVLSSQEPSGDQEGFSRAFHPCERFVKDMVSELGVDTFVPGDGDTRRSSTLQQAKTAYTLACIEQLVPYLGIHSVEDVWSLCSCYLSDPSHRETYESAHSVMLAIFSSHAQHSQSNDHLPVNAGHLTKDSESKNSSRTSSQIASQDIASFVHRITPYYAQCLIENSQEGRLGTAQLRLAYSVLVKSASISGSIAEPNSVGWYCITLILDRIRDLNSKGTVLNGPVTNALDQRLHRLHLTLISTVSSLPLTLMIRALEEIRSMIMKRRQSDSGVESVVVEEERRRQKELVDALFMEISEKVGDQEKEAAMRWWYANRHAFSSSESHEQVRTPVEADPSSIVSRL
ncbi:hypothetical protein H0H93_008783 [Arthromyces matolae]|nr:hypothetical protein H0H93_008783 [Arthromyces matolae]